MAAAVARRARARSLSRPYIDRLPRISVVVPIYNVEPYLDECLASIAAQTLGDIEVILVDDGSTDGSAAIARAWVERDERFRLISQANAGLGAARNTGIDAATGEFLAFVDSDDMLPPNAYELLLAALDETGSDFATGNVRRFDRHGSMQAPFLRRTFRETRLRTHVTKFQGLLVDRIVPNKLWRRSFWDEHHLRFPEGMAHEDIPVVLPAQFLAKTVDVIEEPVYLYRIREGDDRSITQRRTETPMLLDRIAAVQQASAFLAREGPREAKEWYDASVVAEDLRYYLNVLDAADEDYRGLFLDRVNELLDTVDPKVFDELTAIERLKWHLVRRRLMPELLEVLWFQRERLTSTPPLLIDGHWYGDYPYRDDERLKIPREIYRIDSELKFAGRVDELRWEGDTLHIGGYAFIARLGAPRPDFQRVSVSLLRPGPLARVRLMLSAIRLPTRATHRPEVTAVPGHQVGSHEWAGFAATLDARKLRRRARRGDGRWDLYITIRVGRLKRRRAQFWIEGWHPAVASDHTLGEELVLTATPTEEGGIAVLAQRRRPELHECKLAADALELTGELGVPAGAKPVLQIAREDGDGRRRYKMELDTGATPSAFTARVPLAHLLGQPGAAEDDGGEEDEPPGGVVWKVEVTGAGPRRPLALPREAGERAWSRDGQEVAVLRTREGHAALVVRDPTPLVTAVRWTDDHTLVLSGRLDPASDLHELVVRRRYRGDRHVVPLRRDEATFEVELAPAAMPSLAGALPLPEGTWQLFAAPAGAARDDEALVRVTIADALHPELPSEAVVDHKPFRLVRTYKGRAALIVEENLADDERGTFHQRTLRSTAYAARRSEPLLDTVVYDSFRGRQYSDSPRAIHEELVRRGAPVDHVWVVRDGACRVPPSARVVRAGSREHYETLARARWVVVNDHFPSWFRRRDDQVALQTWHGTPLKQLGHDATAASEMTRRFERHWAEQAPNWQFVVSPSAFATPIMRRAYDLGASEILETGYPRNDLFHRRDRAELERRVRERLGIPDGVRTVLYAPTFRDHVIDRKGHYRLDLRLDVERLREAAGPDTVLLFRTHHYIVDPVPATADGFVRDVTSYPDANELLLAADVLVTDYSSMMVDYANTGRPMLVFAYDLEEYRERIRGFYVDLAEVAPSPLLRTSDDVAEALCDLDAVHAQHADRYAAFVRRFCEHDDGGATARVVDRVFGDLG